MRGRFFVIRPVGSNRFDAYGYRVLREATPGDIDSARQRATLRKLPLDRHLEDSGFVIGDHGLDLKPNGGFFVETREEAETICADLEKWGEAGWTYKDTQPKEPETSASFEVKEEDSAVPVERPPKRSAPKVGFGPYRALQDKCRLIMAAGGPTVKLTAPKDSLKEYVREHESRLMEKANA